jgi:hypothetical protein
LAKRHLAASGANYAKPPHARRGPPFAHPQDSKRIEENRASPGGLFSGVFLIAAVPPRFCHANREARGFEMTDRTAELEAAVRAQHKLIAEAQRLLKAYVEIKRVHPDAVINDLLWLFDGPRQREAQRLVREALGEEPGNNA